MYSISTSEGLKFLTASHMPVKTLLTNDGSAQWAVQAAAVSGSIDVIKVDTAGAGYLSVPSVTISGDGTGATANAVVTSNSVTSITMGAKGSGYTYATATLSGGSFSSAATANVIISPPGGHGFDPTEELGGIYILVNSKITGTESLSFSTANQFRKIGLVRDPRLFDNSGLAYASSYRQTYKYGMGVVTGAAFSPDDVVTSGANTAIVIEYDSTNRYLYTTLPVPLPFVNGQTITGPASSAAVANTAAPGLKPYTGHIIYIENRFAIQRAPDQAEDIKLIIAF
jgi:hypothetical protein